MFEFLDNNYQKYDPEFKGWRNALFKSLVILLIFALFQPFGFKDKEALLKLMLVPSYIALAFFNSLIRFYLIRKIIKGIKRWTIKDELVAYVVNILIVAAVVHLVSVLITGDMPLSVEWYLRILLYVTSFYLIFFTIEFFFYNHQSVNTTYQNINSEFEAVKMKLDRIEKQKEELVTISIEKNKIEINRNKIVFIQSVGNYLEFHLHDKGSGLKKILKRGRIHRVEKDLAGYAEFIRCHRAFIVNLNHVKSLTGNFHNARLVFNCASDKVPVSRNQYKSVKEKIEKSVFS
jgi:hypothetical protein